MKKNRETIPHFVFERRVLLGGVYYKCASVKNARHVNFLKMYLQSAYLRVKRTLKDFFLRPPVCIFSGKITPDLSPLSLYCSMICSYILPKRKCAIAREHKVDTNFSAAKTAAGPGTKTATTIIATWQSRKFISCWREGREEL